METWIRLAWLALAAIHLVPSAPAFCPRLVQRLYGVDSGGAAGLLLVHRGALFLAIVALAILAAFDAEARRAAALALTISVLGFLLVYLRAGTPAGPLRTVAIVDAVALAPLAVCVAAAFRR